MVNLGGPTRSAAASAAARRARSLILLGLAATLLTALIAGFTAGCGGGGGSTQSLPTPTPTPSSVATITGAVLLDNEDSAGSKSGIPGLTVTWVNSKGSTVSTTTASDGTFTLTVPSGQTGTVKVLGATAYYDTVTYSNNGTPASASLAGGFSIPSLGANGSYSLGNIVLESTNGPPPPPNI